MVQTQTKKLLLGGLLVAFGVGYLIYASFQDSMLYYLTVDEFLSQQMTIADQGVRIAGTVVSGSIQRQSDSQNITFQIEGRSEQAKMPVTYNGIVPDIFQDGASIVLEGQYNPQQQHFYAVTLMTSCPSKYEKKLQEE